MKFFPYELTGAYDVQRPVLPLTISNELGSSNLFVTDIQGNFDVNYQLNYAFNDDVYIYVFGDRLSVLTMTMLALPGKCEDAKVTAAEIVKFYNKYKLKTSDSSPTPVVMYIGGTGGMTVEGFFIGMYVNLVGKTEDTYMFQVKMLGKPK